MITNELVKIAQHLLNKHYNLYLVEDGILGKNTERGLMYVEALATEWNVERKVIGFIQFMCLTHGINGGAIDGKWGPQIEYGYEQLLAHVETGVLPEPWRDDEGLGAESDPNDKWPVQTQEELRMFYGNPGENQVKVDVPYPLRIAWDKEKVITRFTCHEKVARSIQRVLERVADHYHEDKLSELRLDLWGGCLNVRKMRGGTKWSTHSWGIAIDWDPEENRLKWGAQRASLANPVYDKWWDLWEEEGWVSLGRARNYDWMHVQGAKVRK